MERYVDGDPRAFDELYEAMRGPIISGLRRWLKTDHQVDDAFQITIMKLHTSRARYRRGAPVLPWVLTIARNVAVDQLRSRVAQEQALDPDQAEAIPDETGIDRWSEEDEREVIAAVHDAIDTLPKGVRDVVRLHKIEGKAMAEVAALLGIREGAARVRAHRGYKSLAKQLTGFWSRRD
jgi:RNA polymerase sigma-70 factor, ECF subfamily